MPQPENIKQKWPLKWRKKGTIRCNLTKHDTYYTQIMDYEKTDNFRARMMIKGVTQANRLFNSKYI